MNTSTLCSYKIRLKLSIFRRHTFSSSSNVLTSHVLLSLSVTGTGGSALFLIVLTSALQFGATFQRAVCCTVAAKPRVVRVEYNLFFHRLVPGLCHDSPPRGIASRSHARLLYTRVRVYNIIMLIACC